MCSLALGFSLLLLYHSSALELKFQLPGVRVWLFTRLVDKCTRSLSSCPVKM